MHKHFNFHTANFPRYGRAILKPFNRTVHQLGVDSLKGGGKVGAPNDNKLTVVIDEVFDPIQQFLLVFQSE
jgi:hypothetical protein